MRAATSVVLAAVLLLVTAGAVAAATHEWDGNGYPSDSCQSDTTGDMLWIWTGGTPSTLTINGEEQAGAWVEQGSGAWHFTLDITATNYPPTTASVEYEGDDGTLTLSGCNETASPSPDVSPTPEISPTPDVSPTPAATSGATPTPTRGTLPATDTDSRSDGGTGLLAVLVGIALVGVLSLFLVRWRRV